MPHDDLDRLFDELCDLGPDERAARLQNESLDAAARAQLENVLRHYDALLDEPDAMPARDGVHEEIDRAHAGTAAHTPRRLGPYEILGVLGSGGMGAVYRAQQHDPHREVAIKVLQAGRLIEEHARRFEREAELLARLQHPGIAQVFELGRTEDATYLVMELIDGQRLTTWADEQGLDREARLTLLTSLADAVHHAHLRGVVHRDLKPANVLVNRDGQVKVIDFGVARALDGERSATLATRVGQIVGTLGYMSPEQIRGNPEDIDARADVYGLGVLAFELLSGRLPHELGSKSITEAGRIILEVEPPRLSRIAPDCRGDLEVIVTKALEKDPDRRYASAAAFAADLRHLLSHEPIDARPASTSYQLRKLARRNRTLVAGAATTLIAILVGAGIAWRQAVINEELALEEAAARAEATESFEKAELALQAEAERSAELRQVAAFQEGLLYRIDARQMSLGMHEDMLTELRAVASTIDPTGGFLRRGQELLERINLVNVASRTLHRNLLEPARQELERQFADQPLVRARLLVPLGHARSRAGFDEAAVRDLQEAARIQIEELGERNEETLATRVELAGALTSSGDIEAAYRLYSELEPDAIEVLDLEHAITVDVLLGLAAGAAMRGDAARSEREYARALEACEAVYGPTSQRAFIIRTSLARALMAVDQLERAEALFRELVEESAARKEEGHPPAIRLMGDLAAALINQKRFADAEPLAQEATQRMQRRLGSRHPWTIDMLERHAVCLAGLERHGEAERALREVIGGLRAQGEESAGRVASRLVDLASTVHDQDRHLEAAQISQEALELAEPLGRATTVYGATELLHEIYSELNTLQPDSGYAENAAEMARALESLPDR